MRVEGSVTVGQSAQEVFAYLSDPSHGASWAAGVMEAGIAAGAVLSLGAALQIVGTFLGEWLESSAEVTVFERDQAMGCKSVSGPVPYRVRLALDALPAGIRASGTVEADVRFFRLEEALVGRVAQRQLEHDLATLRDLLETWPPKSTPWRPTLGTRAARSFVSCSQSRQTCHSCGHYGEVNGRLRPMLPTGKNEAFTNRPFWLSDHHGRSLRPGRGA